MGTNRTLGYIIVVIGASVFFLLASTPADAKTSYHPLDFATKNPVLQQVNAFLKNNALVYSSILGTHVECGGGDQTKINLGPVIQNVSDCNECKELAACAGQKKGVSNVGYLWDAHTNQCGLGIPVTEAEARSCEEEEDTCLGVDPAKFALVKDDAKTLAGNARTFWSTYPLSPELLLAVTYQMSGWDPLFGTGSYPGDFGACVFSLLAFEGNTLCNDPVLESYTQSRYGKTCTAMPISAETATECGGKMGLAQIYPVDWETWHDSISWVNTQEIGETIDPWNQRDSFGAAAALLSIFLEESAGDENCAVIKYLRGSGSGCANPSPGTQAAADRIIKDLKPVMKSLLDTGSCPVAPPPGPVGPIPTPCPPETAGAATLKNYISSTFNIHFDGPWTAGGLYDVCNKLYETSGTRFDDFFVNDPDGATVATDGGGGFCSVSGKKVSCDPGMSIIDSRGEIFTFVMFHELGHTLKALNVAAAREADIVPIARFEYSLHLGQTTTPWLFDNTRHISKYPYGLHAGTCPIASIWPSEEYAETVGYYFHPGTGEIMLPADGCMGGPAFKPYVNDNHKAPEHCNLMYDVMGSYNPACAKTLGRWEIHSDVCDATDVGSCQASLMLQFFDMHAADAVQICRVESGGNALARNRSCLCYPGNGIIDETTDPNCKDGPTGDYSVGLLQMNLICRADCTEAFEQAPIGAPCKCMQDLNGDGLKRECRVTNPAKLPELEKRWGFGDPIANAAKALELAQASGTFGKGGTGWDPWTGADVCLLMPHP